VLPTRRTGPFTVKEISGDLRSGKKDQETWVQVRRKIRRLNPIVAKITAAAKAPPMEMTALA
jgi:hypothetical protein